MNGAMYLHCVYIVLTLYLSQEQANSLSTSLKDGLQGAVLYRHVELEAIRLELK